MGIRFSPCAGPDYQQQYQSIKCLPLNSFPSTQGRIIWVQNYLIAHRYKAVSITEQYGCIYCQPQFWQMGYRHQAIRDLDIKV